MASMIKLCGEMRKAFQEDLVELLEQVSEHYGLNRDELMAFAEQKRQESAESVKHALMASKVRKPRVRKEGDAAGPICEAKTAKGTPCQNSAMANCKLCRVHNRKALPVRFEEEPQTPAAPRVVTPPAVVPDAPKKPKKAEHNHKVDEVPVDRCDRCEEHGKPTEDQQYDVKRSLKQQLEEFRAQLIAEDPEYEEEPEPQPQPQPQPTKLVEYEEEEEDDELEEADSECSEA